MGTPRFTPEFKEEAVRQITERGYSVAEVSERLGVSAHSLYKWLRAIKPDNSEQHARDLLEAKSEILKLRAQLKRTEEERDILKKAVILITLFIIVYRYSICLRTMESGITNQTSLLLSVI